MTEKSPGVQIRIGEQEEEGEELKWLKASSAYKDRIVEEATEIKLHQDNIKSKETFKLGKS
jgi:hypothetical protein